MFLEYKYEIEVSWNFGGTLTPIPIEHIRSLIIDSDFDNKHMPILYLTINTGKKLLDKIILNKNDSTLMIDVKKFAVKDNRFVEDYIKDEFLYFLPDDINYTDNFEYTEEQAQRDDVFRQTIIGCIKMDTINRNKKLFNKVFLGASNMDVALYALKDIGDLVIEPMLSNRYDELKIPPIDTISKLLDYLNYRESFYTTPFRFFIDFKCAYLMSSSTSGIPIKGDNINDVFIRVCDPNNSEAYFEGMSKDAESNMYIIPVDAKNTNVYEDNMTEKSFNKLYGITGSGAKKEVNININVSKNSTEKTKIIRVPYENMGLLDIIKNTVEGGSNVLTISKSNIDCSVITMNKHYTIKNYEKYQKIDGDFIISRKKEIFVKEGEYFISECVLNFRSSIK